MYFKCELVIGGYSYLVTNDLKNWDDITSSFKRQDFDGVIRSFSNKFEFCGAAYDLIKWEYRKNYLSASADVVFYTRNNSWLWNERFRLSFDFSTLADDGSIISINAIDDSLESLIKAKRGVQYEYSVSKIKEEAQLYYDRLQVNESVSWKSFGNTTEGKVETELDITASLNMALFPATVISNETGVGGNILFDSTYQSNVPKDIEDGYLIKCVKSTVFQLSIRISLNIPSGKALYMALIKVDSQGNRTTILSNSVSTDAEFRTLFFYRDSEITLFNGDYLYIEYSSIYTFKAVINFGEINLRWKDKGTPVYIDCVTPTTLLNRLLKSINGGQTEITGTIQTLDKRLSECVILPAESVRGLPNAKLYTSYSKFCDWMKAEFGYVPVVGDNNVSFVHRDTLFKNEVVKEIEGYSGFEYLINSSLIYSRVRVGYEKQDYESVNGRDEFRFANEYETGIKLNDNSLELISPYRADAYGIEFLVQKRGEDTTDNTSDNDVFFVNAYEADKYYLRRSEYIVSGVISPDTMFNVVYSPRFMIEANKRFIAASAGKLTFASSEGNSDVVINGIKESSDIELSNSLFTVGNLSFETGDLIIPGNFNGVISIKNQGEVYKGYVEKVGINYGRAESVKYSLIVKSVLKDSKEEKPINKITMEYKYTQPATRKIVSSSPVSSEIIVTTYIVETVTGAISSVSDVFQIPVGGTSSQAESLVLLYPGFHFEYDLSTDEDDVMKYALNIK